jgi:hypothetical protein
LGEKEYSDGSLTTIATLLQHASNLYESNAEFVQEIIKHGMSASNAHFILRL